jgi:peroxiredoxin
MDRWHAILVAGLLASLAVIVTLVRQSRVHRERYAELYERAAYPHVGGFVPGFAAQTLDGMAVTIGDRQDGGTQTLFVFNTTCPYCKASLPSWRAIAATLDTALGAGAVYGISLDSAQLTRSYAQEHDLDFPIVQFPQRKLMALYRTRSVPLTLVLDGEGRIVLSHIGIVAQDSLVESIIKAAMNSNTGMALP